MTVIRRVRSSDHEAVVALHHAALQELDVDAGPGPWDDDLADIDQAYLRAGGEFLVVEDDGEIVAIGALRLLDAHGGEIKRMRVAAGHRRRGHARRLLERLEQHARRAGIRELVLDTTIAQPAARRLYEQAGYVESGRRIHRGLEEVLYAKHLT